MIFYQISFFFANDHMLTNTLPSSNSRNKIYPDFVGYDLRQRETFAHLNIYSSPNNKTISK